MTSARGIHPIAVLCFGPTPVMLSVKAREGLNMRRDIFATEALGLDPPAHSDKNFAWEKKV